MLPLRELERVEWRVLGALRFVDATTGAHSNSIESTWRHAKATLPKYIIDAQ